MNPDMRLKLLLEPSLVRTPGCTLGTQKYHVRCGAGTGLKGGCACVCTHAQCHVGQAGLMRTGQETEVHGRGQRAEAQTYCGWKPRSSRGDLVQLVSMDAGRRTQAKIMGRCL